MSGVTLIFAIRLTFTCYQGELPVARAAVLKHTLRSMHRMMQSSGTAEGLRGLIDSSILKSLKKIIEHRALFGPSVVPMGMSLFLYLPEMF